MSKCFCHLLAVYNYRYNNVEVCFIKVHNNYENESKLTLLTIVIILMPARGNMRMH